MKVHHLDNLSKVIVMEYVCLFKLKDSVTQRSTLFYCIGKRIYRLFITQLPFCLIGVYMLGDCSRGKPCRSEMAPVGDRN